jgi:signal peptidase I
MRRAARAILVAAVRGRRERGGPWGEAVLAELDRTTGRWEALRWAAGGLRAVWHERRARVRGLPRAVRIQRMVAATAVLGLLASLVINQFALTGRYMASTAMAPTVPVGGRYLLDKVGFRVTGFARGDIIEFPIPDAPDNDTTKRVVGLPGDTIECRDGRVYRDGTALDERYLTGDPQIFRTVDCGGPVTVPAGELYVLGDRRTDSRDSRHWGPIPQRSVYGRLLTVIWPLR